MTLGIKQAHICKSHQLRAESQPLSEAAAHLPAVTQPSAGLLLGPQDSQRWDCSLVALTLAIPDAKNTTEIPQSISRFITGNALGAQSLHFLSQNGLWLMASLSQQAPSWVNCD